MKNSDGKEQDDYPETVAMIRNMPDLNPPPDLVTMVMESILSRKRGPFRRLRDWMSKPRSFTFTPLQAGGAAALVIPVLAFLLIFNAGSEKRAATKPLEMTAITLAVVMPDARSVSVIGDFNNWHPQECVAKEDGNKKIWTVTLMLPPGRYEYGFMVDNSLIVPDPLGLFFEEDGFGNKNSVLMVGLQDETTT